MITVEERPIDPKVDRVWFLYVVDETEGPFTVKEIKEKIKNSEAKSSSYVWREGLIDWTILSTLSEFDTNTKSLKDISVAEHTKSSTIIRGINQDAKQYKTVEEVAKNENIAANEKTVETNNIEPIKTKTKIKGITLNSNIIEKVKGSKKPMEERKNRTFLWGFLIFILISGVIYQGVSSGFLDPVLEKMNLKEKVQAMNLPRIIPQNPSGQPNSPSESKSSNSFSDQIASMIRGSTFIMEKVVPKLPQKVRVWLSPVEIPFDVPSTDIVALREAAAEPTTRGARIAVSLPIKYVTQPQFIITSNLPTGTHLDLHLIGKKGTLINSMGFEAKSSAVINDHLARSTPFQTNGKTFPQGDYTLLVYESNDQNPTVQSELAKIPGKSPPSVIPQGKKYFSVDSFFIGGNKDQNYQAELNTYNEKLRVQVPAETLELKQLHATIESMANESAIKFFKLSNRKLTKKDKTEWVQYSNNYKKLSNQIQNQYFANLAQTGTNKFANRVFADVYRKAEQTFILSETLHNKESLFFEKKSNMNDIKALAAQTLSAIKELQKTIAESVSQN